MKWHGLQEVVQIPQNLVHQRPGMMPWEQCAGDGFNPADGTPNARDTVPPDGDRITEPGEGHMVHQVVTMDLVQLSYDRPGRLLPQDVVDLDRLHPLFQGQQKRFPVVIDKFGERLAATQKFNARLDAVAIVFPGQHRDVVIPGHLQNPLPAHLRLGTLPRLAGIGGYQDFCFLRHRVAPP